MAIVTCPEIQWPGFIPVSNSRNPSFAGLTLDAATEKAATILQAPKAGTILKVGWRSATFTSSGNADVRLETRDAATGDPSGTLLATNTNATQAVAAANTWMTTTLTAGATVTKGQIFAVVIAYSSGNWQVALADSVILSANYPYGDHFTGAWAKQGTTMAMALEYSDGSYAFIPGVLPTTTYGATRIDTGTTPDEIGCLFTATHALRVTGWGGYLDLDNDADIVLYDTDGTTPLLTHSIDKDDRQANSGGTFHGWFSSTVNLVAGSQYRLVMKPTTGATGPIIYEWNVASAAVMGALPGGSDWVRTERTNAGAWTQTTTARPQLWLVVNGIDSGDGGGRGHIWTPVGAQGRMAA